MDLSVATVVNTATTSETTTTSSNNCPICTETYTNNIRTPLQCEYCPFVACILCCQKFVLQESHPRCMSTTCGRTWTRQFLSCKFSKAFITKKYRFHVEDVLFEEQKALLPGTQHLAKMSLIRDKFAEEQKSLETILFKVRNDLNKMRGKVQRLDNYLRRRVSGTEPCREVNENGDYMNDDNDDPSSLSKAQKTLIVCKCPMETCRGFVTSNKKGIDKPSTPWGDAVRDKPSTPRGDAVCDKPSTPRGDAVRDKPSTSRGDAVHEALLCGLCGVEICRDCHEVISKDDSVPPLFASLIEGAEAEKDDKKDVVIVAPHICNPIMLASTKAIRRDTRNCPNCVTPIYRIEGCNQMWCTVCNNAFDWKTGQPIQGAVHNPHYFEYLARSNNNRDHNLERGNRTICATDPHQFADFMMDTNRRLSEFLSQKKQSFEQKEDLTNKIKHIRDVSFVLVQQLSHMENETLQHDCAAHPESMTQLRIEFMKNKITEAKFRHRTFFIQKKEEMLMEYRQIWRMFIDVSREICVRNIAVLEPLNPEIESARDVIIKIDRCLETLYTELRGLVAYVNEQSAHISESFEINQFWHIPSIDWIQYKYANNTNKRLEVIKTPLKIHVT